MSHPEFIEIDGKKVSTLDVMLMPCKTKKDLQNWIRTFLGLDMPDCIVCEESSASPMDMLWNVYRASLEGDFAESSQLYFASRGSFKTLGAAVLEIVILLHQRKTVSHMAAILRQSKKCYDYFQYFFRKDVLNKVAFDKKTMERTELKLDSPYGVQPFIQILPCTMQGANCIAKNTGIVLANGLICTAQNILPGDFIKTFDYRKGIEVPVLVGSVSQTKKFARELVFNDGSNLIASEDHQIFTQKGWITVSNLRLGDDVVSPDGNTYTTYMNGETVCGSPLPSFQQFLLGTLLGDSSLKWPSKLEDGSQKNGGNYGVGPRFSCNHGADQYEYLLYKKEILESNGFRVKLIKDSKDQHKIYTNVSDNLCWAYNLLYPESNGRKKTITKKLLQLLDVEALAFWFMDDARGNQKIIGTSKDHAFQLATCGFSHEENGIICEWFRQRWGLDCDVGSITSQYGHYDVIEFSLDSSRRLSEMISPFVHTQLRYKLLPPKSHMFRRCITCGKKIHEKIEYGFKSCCVKRHSTRIGRNYLVGIRDHFNRRVVKINQLPQMELIDLHIDTEDEHLRSFLGNGI